MSNTRSKQIIETVSTNVSDVMEQTPKKHTISGDLKKGAASKDRKADSLRTNGIFGAEYLPPCSSFSFCSLANSVRASANSRSTKPNSSLTFYGVDTSADVRSASVGLTASGHAGTSPHVGSCTVGTADSPGNRASKIAKVDRHYRFNCPYTDKVDYGHGHCFVPKTISQLNKINSNNQQRTFMEMNYACCEDCLCYVCGDGVAAKNCPQWKWDQCLTHVTCKVVGARFCNDEPHCQNDLFPCDMSGIPHCYADLHQGKWRHRWLDIRSHFQATKSAETFKIAMPSMEKWNAGTTSLFKRHPRNMCLEKAFRNVDITRFAIDRDYKDVVLNASSCEFCCCIVCDELASECPQWDYRSAAKMNGDKKVKSGDFKSMPHCLATDLGLGTCRTMWKKLQEFTATQKKQEQVMKEKRPKVGS